MGSLSTLSASDPSVSLIAAQVEEEEKETEVVLVRWFGGKEVGPRGGKGKPAPKESHLQSPLWKELAAQFHLYDSDPTAPFQVTWMILDPVAYGLSTLSRKTSERVGLLFGPQHLVTFRVAPSKGDRGVPANLPLPHQHGREGLGVWTLVAPRLASSVTLGQSLYPSEPVFSAVK